VRVSGAANKQRDPAKNRAARFCGEKEAQQNEREVTFAKKVAASDMTLATTWWRWREYPRTEKQSTGLFFAHCGAPSKFDSSPSGHKLNTPYRETVGGVYLVEMAGVEPASENTFPQISTSVAVL